MSEVLNTNTIISEPEILQRIHKGDLGAIIELYEKYSTLLYSLIKRIIKDEKKSEEILADIFISIRDRINHFDFNLKNAFTWLVTLTRNYAVYELRKGEGKVQNISSEALEKYIIPNLSHLAEPLDIEQAYEQKNIVRDAFNKLDNTRQHLITLSYYDGLTQEEIPEKLNIPLITVESEIRTSLINLNEKFKEKPSIFIVENELIEKIYPFVLGCLDFEEQAQTFDRFKASEPFPWKLLGEYQNLISLLPLIINPELPSEDVKEKILNHINQLKKIKSFEPIGSSVSGLKNPEEKKSDSAGKTKPSEENIFEKEKKENIKKVLDKDLNEYPVKGKKRNFALILSVVLIILFIISAVLAYLFYNDRVLYYENQIKNLTDRIENITQELRNRPEIPGLGVLKNPETIQLTNMSDSFSSGEVILSYEDKRGYLHIRSLPVLDPDNAYQLWGNFNGNFISLGVFKTSSRPDYFPFTLPESVNEGTVEFYVIESNAEGSRRPGSKIYLQGKTE